MTRRARSHWCVRAAAFRAAVMMVVVLASLVPAAQAEEVVAPPPLDGSSIVPAEAPSGFAPTATIEDDNPFVAFAGGWRFASTSAASGGTRRVATAVGAIARFSFNGTGAALVMRVSPSGGRIEVSLDDTASVVVDLASASAVERERVWVASGLAQGVHSVVVRTLESSPAAQVIEPVSVDALLVEGVPLRAASLAATTRVEESDRRIRFLGNWRQRASLTGASRGRVATANAAKASVVLSFRGTSVSWLAPNQGPGSRAQITLDSTSYGVVSLARAGARGAQRVMWSIGGLANVTHTLVIRAVTAPAGSSRVALDAFDIGGGALEARPASSLGYSWRDYIVIDKSEFRLYLVRDGRLVRTYPVAHGRIGMPTPVGVWRVDAKYYPSPTGVYGPRKLRMFRRRGYPGHYRFVFTAYGMHGTNEPWVIGTLASHGCIRLYNDDVLDFFGRVPLGTMVVTRD